MGLAAVPRAACPGLSEVLGPRAAALGRGPHMQVDRWAPRVRGRFPVCVLAFSTPGGEDVIPVHTLNGRESKLGRGEQWERAPRLALRAPPPTTASPGVAVRRARRGGTVPGASVGPGETPGAGEGNGSCRAEVPLAGVWRSAWAVCSRGRDLAVAVAGGARQCRGGWEAVKRRTREMSHCVLNCVF